MWSQSHLYLYFLPSHLGRQSICAAEFVFSQCVLCLCTLSSFATTTSLSVSIATASDKWFSAAGLKSIDCVLPAAAFLSASGALLLLSYDLQLQLLVLLLVPICLIHKLVTSSSNSWAERERERERFSREIDCRAFTALSKHSQSLSSCTSCVLFFSSFSSAAHRVILCWVVI